MDAHRLKLLQNMPIFSALNESALEFIERHCETRTILLGDPVFLEGDPANSLFILESGEAEVLKTCDPDLRRLSYLNPGDCFGEMAIVDHQPRSATVMAISDCQALEITAEHLYALKAHDPDQFIQIQANLLRELSRRLRFLDDKLAKTQPEMLQKSLLAQWVIGSFE